MEILAEDKGNMEWVVEENSYNNNYENILVTEMSAVEVMICSIHFPFYINIFIYMLTKYLFFSHCLLPLLSKTH